MAVYLFAAIVVSAAASCTAYGESLETCRIGHLCVAPREFENRQFGRPDGGSYGCAIRLRGDVPEQDRELVVALLAGEGTVLPYMIFEIHLRKARPAGESVETIAPRRGWIYTADNKLLTKDWDATIRNGVLTLRFDLLPENRNLVAQVAELVTADNYLVLLEHSAGTYSHYFVAPQGSFRQVTETFLECVSRTRTAVRGLVPEFR